MPESKAFGGTIPGFYDRHLGPLLFTQFAANMALRVAGLKPQAVLEVACGTGIVTKALARCLGRNAQIVATDLSPEMVEFARKAVNEAQVEFRSADAMELPFTDESFDVVVCQFGMMLFPDKIAAAREAHRVLKHEGTFLFSVWGPPVSNPWSQLLETAFEEALPDSEYPFMPAPFSLADPDILRDIAVSAGFESVTVEEVDFQSPEIPVRELATGFVHGTLISRHLKELGHNPDQVLEIVTQSLANQVGEMASSHLHALVVIAKRN